MKFINIAYGIFVFMFSSLSCTGQENDEKKSKCLKTEVEEYINHQAQSVEIRTYCILESGEKSLHGKYQRIGISDSILYSEGNYQWGGKTGEWVYYHSAKDTLRKENYQNGLLDGEFVEFHENGKLWIKGEYKLGEKKGIWEEYSENGIKIRQGKYIGEKRTPYSETILDSLLENGVIVSGLQFPIIEEIKDGVWNYWDIKGVLIKKELWDKGKLIETKEHW